HRRKCDVTVFGNRISSAVISMEIKRIKYFRGNPCKLFCICKWKLYLCCDQSLLLCDFEYYYRDGPDFDSNYYVLFHKYLRFRRCDPLLRHTSRKCVSMESKRF